MYKLLLKIENSIPLPTTKWEWDLSINPDQNLWTQICSSTFKYPSKAPTYNSYNTKLSIQCTIQDKRCSKRGLFWAWQHDWQSRVTNIQILSRFCLLKFRILELWWLKKCLGLLRSQLETMDLIHITVCMHKSVCTWCVQMLHIQSSDSSVY